MALRIGVIGGSGLYDLEGLEDIREEQVSTPFGEPSDSVLIGRLGETELVFLPRHGRGHRFNPSEVNYRANVFAMKQLGVSWIISVSAVGSLKEEIVPGHMVLVDQFIDRTKGVRASTFFEGGVVGHVGFGDPICETLRQILLGACREVGAIAHDGGTYVCMEGPAFSTRAESHLYRSWGASVIGMTNLTEARLAREAGISYATLAMATDYDCWYEGHDDVTVEQVIAVLQANVAMARQVISASVPALVEFGSPSPMADAAAHAVMTSPDRIPEGKKATLALLLGEYA